MGNGADRTGRKLRNDAVRGRRFGNCKQRGEWAELCFMARAAGMGLCVCKPDGDSAQYDVGIEDAGGLLCVQIKSTTYSRDGAFTCIFVGRGREGYVVGGGGFFVVCRGAVVGVFLVPF